MRYDSTHGTGCMLCRDYLPPSLGQCVPMADADAGRTDDTERGAGAAAKGERRGAIGGRQMRGDGRAGATRLAVGRAVCARVLVGRRRRGQPAGAPPREDANGGARTRICPTRGRARTRS